MSRRTKHKKPPKRRDGEILRSGWGRVEVSHLWHYFDIKHNFKDHVSLCGNHFLKVMPKKYRHDPKKGPVDCSECWDLLKEREGKESPVHWLHKDGPYGS